MHLVVTIFNNQMCFIMPLCCHHNKYVVKLSRCFIHWITWTKALRPLTATY